MFTFTISPDGEPSYTLTATTRDVARWEKTAKGQGLRQLEETMRATDLYALAYYAAVRQQLFSGKLSEFQESCDLNILEDDEADEDPTPPGV